MTTPAGRVLPPGTILQHMYLRERLTPTGADQRFIEVGAGEGHISELMLDLGWTGRAVDLSDACVRSTRTRLANHISEGRFEVSVQNWLDDFDERRADLVISCMVIEHLDDVDEERYFVRCADALRPGGFIALIVPAGAHHWSVEDDIAGHVRRYASVDLIRHLDDLGWVVTHCAGLTYPLSNALLPLSSVLVRCFEGRKRTLSMHARTTASGCRRVAMKTTFPAVAGWILNERVMRPFHFLQKRFRHHPDAMVLYLEARPKASS